MDHQTVAGLHLYYQPSDHEAAAILVDACQRSVNLLQLDWGLAVPEDCRVYVMTSGLGFLLHSAPWPWKGYLLLALPWFAWRASATWAYSGGWSLPFGRRKVVGVKPPRLLQAADRSLGSQIYTRSRDPGEAVGSITCHELTHAFTFHLKLPPWLHEGLATLAMEAYLGWRLIRPETLDRVAHLSSEGAGRRTVFAQRGARAREALLDWYVRGYWLTRYIAETRPQLLKALLSERHAPAVLDEQLAAAYGKTPASFWGEIDAELVSHFDSASQSSGTDGPQAPSGKLPM